jgi:hypothetical protein
MCCLVLWQPVSGEVLEVAGEVTLPLPDNWLVTTDTESFPVQLLYIEGGAEILLFRSVVSDDELITSEEDLRLSVKEVETGVIGDLPDGTLLTSTGFYESDRTGFVLEFLSTDTVSGMPLMHRLEEWCTATRTATSCFSRSGARPGWTSIRRWRRTSGRSKRNSGMLALGG